MAGIATLVLITTINLRMGESVSEAGDWYLFLSLPDYCIPLSPFRFRNENIVERLPDLASPSLDSTTLLKIGKGWGREGAESIAI